MSDENGRSRQRGEDGDDELAEVGEVVVPWDRLSAGALRGVIEELITREGTDYGHDETPLATKVEQVRRQLERGEVVVVFDGRSRSVGIVRAADLRAR